MHRPTLRALILAPALLAACASDPPADQASLRRLEADRTAVEVGAGVRYWGELRPVLREGLTEARVGLDAVVGPDTVAVGLLEGLSAEVTVIGGVVHLAEVIDATAPDGVRTPRATVADRATLLVAADVPQWAAIDLGPLTSLDDLEQRLRTAATDQGLPPGPFPFRVEGRATTVDLHVLDHSCPLANPDGPAPWRHTATDTPVVLVGFHAPDSAGVLTHHDRTSHTHAYLPNTKLSGHLDAIRFNNGARLFLPAR